MDGKEFALLVGRQQVKQFGCVALGEEFQSALFLLLGFLPGGITLGAFPALLEPHDMVDVSFPLMPYKDGLFHFGPVMVP